MPAGRKPAHSQEQFIATAIALADCKGLSELTLSALGDAVGSSTTAIYRYFNDKEELIRAMRQSLLEQTLAALTNVYSDPIERFLTAAHAFRSTAREHPCLSQLMALQILDDDYTSAASGTIVAALQELGLSGELLVRGYQQIESLIVGQTQFDFSGAPTHVIDRHKRLTSLGIPDFDRVLLSSDVTAENTENAFEANIRAVLRSLEDQARPTRQ